MRDGAVDPVVCASYTHARRHPMVLGRIAGWAPPFQLTITQILVLLAVFVALTWSWSLWAQFLPSTVALLVAGGAPMAAAWAVRRVRIEGRSLARAALGYVALWCTPAGGVIAGRTHRPRRPARTGGDRMWLQGRAR